MMLSCSHQSPLAHIKSSVLISNPWCLVPLGQLASTHTSLLLQTWGMGSDYPQLLSRVGNDANMYFQVLQDYYSATTLRHSQPQCLHQLKGKLCLCGTIPVCTQHVQQHGNARKTLGSRYQQEDKITPEPVL